MMPKMKKVFAGLMMSVMLVSAMTITASAAYGQGTENFDVYINGGSKVSSLAVDKTDAGPMWVQATVQRGSSVRWLPSENVNLRGRTSGGTKCTELGVTNTPGTQKTLGYYSGYGTQGAPYRIAVQYDNNNPYTHLELTVSWRP